MFSPFAPRNNCGHFWMKILHLYRVNSINFTQNVSGSPTPYIKLVQWRKTGKRPLAVGLGIGLNVQKRGWASWASSRGPFCYSLSSSVEESGGGCCQSALGGEGKIPAVDGWNPASTTWSQSNLVSNGISYQPQLVQDFWNHQQYGWKLMETSQQKHTWKCMGDLIYTLYPILAPHMTYTTI